MRSRWAAIAMVVVGAAIVFPARGQPAAARGIFLDRVVVRWSAPETGGASKPQYVFARELAFQARLEALADNDADTGAYRERHVRAALDRHIAESLLASLPVIPAPKPAEVAGRAEAARSILELRVRGRSRLIAAALAEGIGTDELDSLLRRGARASIYLDRMVAPMLEPSELELRDALLSGGTPFEGLTYEAAAPALARWFVARKMAEALDGYYQNARSRVRVVVIGTAAR